MSLALIDITDHGQIAFVGDLLTDLFAQVRHMIAREPAQQVGGAVLMGFGGVIAMGCSVGQAVTAALAWSGPVTLIAIMIGGLTAGSWLQAAQ